MADELLIVLKSERQPTITTENIVPQLTLLKS